MAAGDIKLAYANSANFTVTLASLASSATAGRETTAIDNTTNLYEDAICQVKVALQAGSPANDKKIYIYAYASVDGTTYTDNATGSDAAITLTDPPNARLVAEINAPSSGALTWESSPFSIAWAFDGVLPPKWGLIIRNYTGVTLSATEGNHAYFYRGVYRTIAS